MPPYLTINTKLNGTVHAWKNNVFPWKLVVEKKDESQVLAYMFSITQQPEPLTPYDMISSAVEVTEEEFYKHFPKPKEAQS